VGVGVGQLWDGESAFICWWVTSRGAGCDISGGILVKVGVWMGFEQRLFGQQYLKFIGWGLNRGYLSSTTCVHCTCQLVPASRQSCCWRDCLTSTCTAMMWTKGIICCCSCAWGSG
jgi:hypothetical protein